MRVKEIHSIRIEFYIILKRYHCVISIGMVIICRLKTVNASYTIVIQLPFFNTIPIGLVRQTKRLNSK